MSLVSVVIAEYGDVTKSAGWRHIMLARGLYNAHFGSEYVTWVNALGCRNAGWIFGTVCSDEHGNIGDVNECVNNVDEAGESNTGINGEVKDGSDNDDDDEGWQWALGGEIVVYGGIWMLEYVNCGKE